MVVGHRSSVVEHTLGKGGVVCSIHIGGTIYVLPKILTSLHFIAWLNIHFTY